MRRKNGASDQAILRKLFSFLRPRQKAQFLGVLVILALSAGLTQLTPLAIEYLTDPCAGRAEHPVPVGGSHPALHPVRQRGQ